jgi:Tol biopolymer transport system component
VRAVRAIPAMICLIVMNGVIRASDQPGKSLPPNLMSVAILHPALEKMRQSSPIFRRQCRRLAGASHLRVNLVLEELSRRPSHRARAAMEYRSGLLVSVTIHLTSFDEPVELIAHEIEHVIEQLDGVDLEAHARTGTVWKSEDGAFETRRAIEVGRRVLREVSLSAAATQPPMVQRRSYEVVDQQRAFASVHDPPSGRVSADGRYVVLSSRAILSPADGNTMRDIYVWDVATRLVTLETPGAAARPANGESVNPDISGDGRYVVFESTAGNLTTIALSSGVPRVFWRDRQTGVTRLLSTTPTGEPANGLGMTPAISADGGTAVFSSSATNLIDQKMTSGNGIGVYRIELRSNRRSRVDVTSDGGGHTGQSASPTISGDGRYVAFASDADLTINDRSAPRDQPRDQNGLLDVYVRDVLSQHTRRVSVASSGSDSDGASYHPAISIDGRHVVFVSKASNLTSVRSRSHAQVFVRDLETGTIEMVSHTLTGRPGDAASAWPALSGDGSVIAYQSLASNLLCEGECRDRDINLVWDIYVYERSARHTTRASADQTDEWMESSRGPSLNETGRVLTFASTHPGSLDDEEHDEDLFVVELSRKMSGSLSEVLDQHQVGHVRVPVNEDALSVR